MRRQILDAHSEPLGTQARALIILAELERAELVPVRASFGPRIPLLQRHGAALCGEPFWQSCGALFHGEPRCDGLPCGDLPYGEPRRDGLPCGDLPYGEPFCGGPSCGDLSCARPLLSASFCVGYVLEPMRDQSLQALELSCFKLLESSAAIEN